MADPTITVRVIPAYLQVPILGTDEQGRTLVLCPSRGCGETAQVEDDGRVACPRCSAMRAAMARMFADVEPLLREALDG